jgi:sugar phosphate isomerase/epimerase
MQSFPIGVMVNNLERDRLRAFDVAATLGFNIVHTSAIPEAWLTGPERQLYIDAARKSGVKIASMFVGFDGQSYADMASIRRTVGLVIPELREQRVQVALACSELARELGVPSLSGHLGFLPTNEDEYRAVVGAMRRILDRCLANQQTFYLETGQESAAELLRFMAAVDRRNLGVNFDPANFILYGSDDPDRAFDLLTTHIRGVHCKDALAAADSGQLGTEVPLGQGQVNLGRMLRRLKEIDYRGPLVIERESGSDPIGDILNGRQYLLSLDRSGTTHALTYERFTNRACVVMKLADEEARRLNHDYLGSEHILLGLINEGARTQSKPGLAAQVLRHFKLLDLRKLRIAVETIAHAGAEPISTDELPANAEARRVMEYAVEEARRLHLADVGTGLLLLGLLHEQQGVVRQVFRSCEVDVEEARARLVGLLRK